LSTIKRRQFNRNDRNDGGFTLLELLFVMLIIGLLAVIILPVINRAKTRTRQTDCLNQLRQLGIAHHSFAHEHNGLFPFQVPMREGGTLELVQAAARSGGSIQTTFQHFRALSNDLVDPKVLTCPADTRTRVDSFARLNNDNLSYFIAVTADYNRFEDVLSGDRNIRLNGVGSLSVARFSPNTQLTWTGEMHEYSGNILFSGGHVARTESAALQGLIRDSTNLTVAMMPVDFGSPSGASPNNSSAAQPESGFSSLQGAVQSASGTRSQSSGQSSSDGASYSDTWTPPPSKKARRTMAKDPDSLIASGSPSVTSVDSTNRARVPSLTSAETAPVGKLRTPSDVGGSLPQTATMTPGLNPNWWLFFLIGLAVAVLVAILVYRYDRRKLARASVLRRRVSYGILEDRRRRGRRW